MISTSGGRWKNKARSLTRDPHAGLSGAKRARRNDPRGTVSLGHYPSLLDGIKRLDGLIAYLSRRYLKVVEVGIGNYAKVALALETRGLSVVATDIQPQAMDLPVEFDDVRAPRLNLYKGAQAIYSVRPPPELVPALKRLAQQLAVDLIVKPLASEPVDGLLVNEAGSFFYLFPSKEQPV